jgi:F0F1-type ATP synthase membrane subunit b/b'
MGQVGEKQERYNGEVLEARSKGYELIEKEKSAAMSEREGAIAAVKDEVAQKFAEGKEELEKQTGQARAALAKEAEAMADKISSRILKV